MFKNKEGAALYIDAANTLFNQGNYKAALPYFDTALKLDPQNGDIYCKKGTVLNALRQYREAIECFDLAIELDPTYATAHFNKGKALQFLRQKEEAIIEYDKSIELDPKFADAYFRKGHTLSTLGYNKEAIIEYDKAIGLNPKFAIAHLNKGVALSALGQMKEAIMEYDKAIELDPKDATAHLYKGKALSALGQKEEAIIEYDKAIELDPHYAAAHFNKGHALSDLGRNEEAIIEYDKVIELDPKDTTAHHNKGVALSALGQMKEAIIEYDKAIKLNPEYALYYCNKGKALLDLGGDNEALICFNKAYDISQSGTLSTSISQRHKNYLESTLNKERVALLKKLADLSAIELPSIKKADEGVYLELLSEEELNNIRTTREALEKDKKEKIYAAVEALNPSSGAKSVDIEKLLSEMSEIKERYNRDHQEHIELKNQVAALKASNANKVDRSEVSYAIKTNADAESKAHQLKQISSRQELADYYKAFVFTFSATYSSAQNILLGKVKLDTDDIKVSIAANLISFTPLVGNILGSGLEAVHAFFKSAKFKKNAVNLTKLASNHEELDKIVGDIARDLALNPFKIKELQEDKGALDKKSQSWIKKIVEQCKQVGIETHASIYGERFVTPAAKLGNKDANTIIDAWINEKVTVGRESMSSIYHSRQFSKAFIDLIIDPSDKYPTMLTPPQSPDEVCGDTANPSYFLTHQDTLSELLSKFSLKCEPNPRGCSISGISDRATKEFLIQKVESMGYQLEDRCSGQGLIKVKELGVTKTTDSSWVDS